MTVTEEAEMSMELGLKGKSALVTGAGRGIGEACALGLARAGANPILVSRTKSDLERVAEQARGFGVEPQVISCDVTDRGEVEELFAALDVVDVLVNGAGGNIPEPFVEVSEEHLDQLVELNLKSVFRVTQAATRLMVKEEAGGAVVNITSQMGRVGAPNRSVYCATKHAVEGLTRALAVELAPDGIRVNSVAPTFINTPMTAPFFEDEEFRSAVLEQIPLGRIGEVDDVVGAVLFLASSAAGLITGASLVVDGGWTAQ
jgi:NAD(P)-dependent dehydrogenase (short-subunit alcohol dehydrogenase family)